MPETGPTPKRSLPEERMLQEVASKQKRLERRSHQWKWSSIEVLGLIGWSVTVPTLAGAALGIWIDSRWPTRFSWTLMLLLLGLLVGCVHVWLRVKEDHL